MKRWKGGGGGVFEEGDPGSCGVRITHNKEHPRTECWDGRQKHPCLWGEGRGDKCI